MRILVANRGEIARRIMRTAARLGHETVAAYADPDRHAPFVAEATRSLRLGPADLAASYLSSERLLAAAAETGATAVHPGYGFLAESAAFARAVEAAGLVWIGPHAKAIEQMGSKIEARALATAAGVPTIPGFDRSQEAAALASAAAEIGFPVLVKASAGGGGKGIRIVRQAGDFDAALSEAAREAERAFGDGAMMVERYIERARHVEVQIVGDRHGNVIDLGTRECSVQRRYQKLLEEAPAPRLSDETRAGLCEAARELAASIGYDSAGTVEFVVDDETEAFYFLEMNTRLQVEHPVTEAVTGLDLVALQLACAEGQRLSLEQADVTFRGHAFEVRLNAEDAAAGFAPQTGEVTHLRVPPGVRFESAVAHGSTITPHYDSMVAKLVTHGADREAARRRMTAALDALVIGGLVTNAGFQRWLVAQPAVVEARVTTRFLDEQPLPAAPDEADAARVAARAWRAARRAERTPGPWSALGAFRVVPHTPTRPIVLADRHGAVHEMAVAEPVPPLIGDTLPPETMGEAPTSVSVNLAARSIAVNRAGHTHTFRALSRSEHWAPSAAVGHGGAEATVAPFPAIVTEVPVRAGDSVAGGDVVVVIEAMKMLHSLTARGAARVAEVRVAPGDSVASNQVLVTYETGSAEDAEAGD